MRLLTPADLWDRGIKYTNKHLLHLERLGKFPRRVKLGGGNRNAWPEAEIDAYLESLVAARDAEATAPPEAA